jgi:hypothetical protein
MPSNPNDDLGDLSGADLLVRHLTRGGSCRLPRIKTEDCGVIRVSQLAVPTTGTRAVWLRSTQPGFEPCRVCLESTPCHLGGERWWFLCPRCGRRAGKLFLPPGHSNVGVRRLPAAKLA